MTLHIQDPTDPASAYLIDTLRNACQGAVRGAGAFAFLSAGGVKLFLQDSAFQTFGQAGGSFNLIAGVDAITDDKAMIALNEAKADTPALTARIHMPSHPRSIFHPKVAWFEKPDGGVLVAGSGNLTAGGLRWNVEAFSVTTLSKAEISALSAQWDAFTARSAASLLAPDDPRVLQRLQQNAKFSAAAAAIKVKVQADALDLNAPEVDQVAFAASQAVVDSVPPVLPSSGVLVAEIPRSGTRWKQANFDYRTFVDFFGASTAVARDVFFFQVKPDGTLAKQEVRPAVTVVSQNYRFELDAATGIAYPEAGRPIGVFVKVAVRTFTYMLVLPGTPEHVKMNALLAAAVPDPGPRMRRIVFTAGAVQAAWPTAPLWRPLTL